MENCITTTGKVKTYQSQKGFGFATTKDFGDVFFHQSALEKGFVPNDRQAVCLEIVPSSRKQGAYEAVSVKPDLTPLPSRPFESPLYEGRIKSYNTAKGFGFASIQEKGDVFVHASKIVAGYVPIEGDYVLLRVTPSKKKSRFFRCFFCRTRQGINIYQ